MAGKELGTKHLCFKCGTKFYDFRKPEPICPKCGADQRESPAVKAPPSERRPKGLAKPAREEAERAVEEGVDEAELEAELDEDSDEEAEEDDA